MRTLEKKEYVIERGEISLCGGYLSVGVLSERHKERGESFNESARRRKAEPQQSPAQPVGGMTPSNQGRGKLPVADLKNEVSERKKEQTSSIK